MQVSLDVHSWILIFVNKFPSAGKHHLDRKEKTQVIRNVSLVIYNPDYNLTTASGDVALVKLSKDLDFDGKDSHLGPICLPDSQDLDQVTDKVCTASGWGTIDHCRFD